MLSRSIGCVPFSRSTPGLRGATRTPSSHSAYGAPEFPFCTLHTAPLTPCVHYVLQGARPFCLASRASGRVAERIECSSFWLLVR
jgi:hypothetical protein